VSDASGTIQHVSDTARWVALYRAMESERPDALSTTPTRDGWPGSGRAHPSVHEAGTHVGLAHDRADAVMTS